MARRIDPAKAERIIEAAAQLFAERHYHEVRMDDIAARAGVAKGTLYLHFKAKEDLYLGLILHGTQRLFDDVRGQMAGAGSANERLSIFVRETIRFFERYPYFLELVQRVEMDRSAAATAPLRATRGQFLQLLKDLVAEFNTAGRAQTADPEFAALALMGMIREVVRSYPRPSAAPVADWLVHQFLHGISGPYGR